MIKIINKLLFKIGLHIHILPRNTRNNVVFTWAITHKGHHYGLLCRCIETDLECINNSISHIPRTIERTLRDLNILPRPEGFITNEMWERMMKEDKQKI